MIDKPPMATTKRNITDKIRGAALKMPGVETGVSCKGTSLEATTYGVKGKAFLFFRVSNGTCHLRLKLDASRAEAAKLANGDPGRFAVGAQGWAKLTFALEAPPPVSLLTRWIGESHRTLSGARPDSQ